MPVIEPARAGRQGSSYGLSSHSINWRNPPDNVIAAFIDTEVRRHDQQHYRWVRRARLQLAWAAGDQLKRWDNEKRCLADSYDVESQRIALFVNRLKPAILNWISLITARPVSFRVSPATAEDQDIASARVQDKLSRYYWKKLLGDRLFIEALWMLYCTGCVFLQSTWDPLIGDEFAVSPPDLLEPSELQSPEGGNGLNIRTRFVRRVAELLGVDAGAVQLDEQDRFRAHAGDLACELLTGFDIVPPQRAESIEQAPWLIVRRYRHMEDLLSRYGKKAKGISPTTEDSYLGHVDYGTEEQWSGGYGQTESIPSRSPDHVRVFELWRPKTRKYPNGFHAVVSQNTVLKKGENPYEHGEIPVVMLQELPSPKKFWPPSTIQDMMSLQAEINVSRSQVAQHKDQTVEPRIIAERGVGLDPMAFQVPREIVEVNPGKLDAVKPWVPEPLPSYMVYWEQSLQKDFEDVARNHAPTQGKPTGTVRSGRQTIAYQEADARMNAPMMRMLRDDLGHVCRQWMMLLRQYADEERTTTIIGESNEPEVVTWSQQDLPSAEFNVECELGSSVDRQTTMELIDMMTARGWLSPEKPGDREQVYRWLGQGVTQEVDESQQDRSNAAVENQEMIAGTLPPVSDGDDHTVHLLEHRKAQKGANYRRAVRVNPEIDKMFAVHTRNHERQRIATEIRQRVFAAEIQRDLAASAGLIPPEPDGGARSAPSGPQRSGAPSAGRPGAVAPQKPQPQRPGPPDRARRGSSRPPPQGFTQTSSGVSASG